MAVEQLLETYPEYRRRFVMIQLAEPTRRGSRPTSTCARGSGRRLSGSTERTGQVTIVRSSCSNPSRAVRGVALSARRRPCIVSSLHDGMNLVGKEFVRARTDDLGVLVLSTFTGAARSLEDALVINPFDPHGTADVIARALEMRPESSARGCASFGAPSQRRTRIGGRRYARGCAALRAIRR